MLTKRCTGTKAFKTVSKYSNEFARYYCHFIKFSGFSTILENKNLKNYTELWIHYIHFIYFDIHVNLFTCESRYVYG